MHGEGTHSKYNWLNAIKNCETEKKWRKNLYMQKLSSASIVECFKVLKNILLDTNISTLLF